MQELVQEIKVLTGDKEKLKSYRDELDDLAEKKKVGGARCHFSINGGKEMLWWARGPRWSQVVWGKADRGVRWCRASRSA